MACEAIHDQALSQITSEPWPESSKRWRGRVYSPTKREINQIEADFKVRVKELALQEGLLDVLRYREVL
jgi:hypothetical protein